MSDVLCIRCNGMVPAQRADVVGNGYRCDRCTMIAETTEDRDAITDHVDPATRAQLAKSGKRKFIVTLAVAAACIVTPTAIGFAVGGALFAAGGFALGLYGSGQGIGIASETYYAQWKRYGRAPELPAARLRKP